MAKTLVGVVTSDKADKTIVVTVATRETHPLYHKQYSSSKKFMAHDENNEARTGDKVAIEETRPLSARKRFTLKEVIERPVLRDGVVGDVEVPAPEKKEIEKKDKLTVDNVEEKPKKAPAKAKKTGEAKDQEAKGDDK
jgi:small subunit ribosomal protein S17